MEAGVGWAGWPCPPSVECVNLRTQGGGTTLCPSPGRVLRAHTWQWARLDAESQSAKHITEHLRWSREGRWTWKWVSACLDLKQETECTTNQICLLGWKPCSYCYDTMSSYDVNTCLQHWILWSSTFYSISTQEMSLRKQGMFLASLLWSSWFLRETLTSISHQWSCGNILIRSGLSMFKNSRMSHGFPPVCPSWSVRHKWHLSI